MGMAADFSTNYHDHKLSALGNKVQEYIESLKVKAEDLIFNGFPDKIVQLNDIIETSDFKNKLNVDVRQDLNIPVSTTILGNTSDGLPPAKRLRYTNNRIASENSIETSEDTNNLLLGPIPINKHVMELVAIVKPHIRSLVEDTNMLCNINDFLCFDISKYTIGVRTEPLNVDMLYKPGTIYGHAISHQSPPDTLYKGLLRKLFSESGQSQLKMWITVMIPKIEDGNNFGVSIQAGTLAEIQVVEVGTSAFFEQISKYYVARGKLISKVRKYPHVDDYRHAVEELDEKEYLSLCLMMVEIRNHYCCLHDTVLKNFEKIKKPRITNASESFC